MISVVIPVKNGGETLRRCLAAIRAQKTADAVEIVVVDSGSTDGSRDLVRSFGGRVHEIAPEAFNHGGTRNLGVSHTKGEIVVFTVQDALPLGNQWLEHLTVPLREENSLAGTYARQIAYEAAPPHQRFYIEHRYGPTPRVQEASEPDQLTVDNVLFSNVSSAIRRPLLEAFPFADDIPTAEDLEWCGRVLLAGYQVAYVPDSVVRHSHDYSSADVLKRYFSQGAAAERSFMARGRTSSRSVRGEGARFVKRELAWLWRSGNRMALPSTLIHEATRFTGFQLGVHHRRVPLWLRRRN